MQLKRFLLIGVLFVAFFNPPAHAQSLAEVTINASVAGVDCWTYPSWCLYWVSNNDDRVVGAFGVMRLPFPPDYLFVPDEEPNWITWKIDDGDGTTSVWWAAFPGNEIGNGGSKLFWVYAWGAQNVDWGGYCLGGVQAANCDYTYIQQW